MFNIGNILSSALGFIGNIQQRNFEKQQAADQRAFSSEQAAIQRDWNETMADKQNAWNLEMWDKQNAYNTPLEQVNRMRDAGLNPLFYGLDGSSAGSAQPAAQPLGYEQPSYQRANMSSMPNPVTAALDSAVKYAQVHNIQADTAKKTEETVSEVVSREKTLQDIENVKQELNNKIANEKLTDAQREQIELSMSWLDRLNEATIKEKESASALNDAQKKRIEELLSGEKILQSKNIADFDKQWKKIEAEISKMAKEEDILELDIENYMLNHMQHGFMGSGLSVVNLGRSMFNSKPVKQFSSWLAKLGL